MPIAKVKLNIEGMHCGACATAIELLLSNKEGVTKAKVDFAQKIGEIEYDPEKIKVEDLIKDIQEIGYQAFQI